jgi:hypothetical protein
VRSGPVLSENWRFFKRSEVEPPPLGQWVGDPGVAGSIHMADGRPA